MNYEGSILPQQFEEAYGRQGRTHDFLIIIDGRNGEEVSLHLHFPLFKHFGYAQAKEEAPEQDRLRTSQTVVYSIPSPHSTINACHG